MLLYTLYTFTIYRYLYNISEVFRLGKKQNVMRWPVESRELSLRDFF